MDRKIRLALPQKTQEASAWTLPARLPCPRTSSSTRKRWTGWGYWTKRYSIQWLKMRYKYKGHNDDVEQWMLQLGRAQWGRLGRQAWGTRPFIKMFCTWKLTWDIFGQAQPSSPQLWRKTTQVIIRGITKSFFSNLAKVLLGGVLLDQEIISIHGSCCSRSGTVLKL